MLDVDVLAQGLFTPEQVHVRYDPACHLEVDPATQHWMDVFWREQLIVAEQQQRLLFDAPLYRLIAATVEGSDLHITLGPTSYKEYMTTRAPAFAKGRPRSALSNALAVCSVVETSDGYILLDRRQGVDVYVGRYHVIGGFVERGLDVAPRTSVPDPCAAICREIREETGVLADDICTQYCLGALYDLPIPHSELIFITQLHIPLAEVGQRQPEDLEVPVLYPLKVTASSLEDFILEHHGNISTTGEPNLLFYGAWKFGPDWLTNILTKVSS